MHPYTSSTESLRSFLNDPKILNVVHYACESFYGKSGPTRICAIAVKHPAETKVFSIYRYCLDNKIYDPASLQPNDERFAEAERQLLEEFFAYATKQGEHALWLHWNMNSPSYGFAHLEHRYKLLSGTDPFHIPEANRLDLDSVLQGIYGQYYMCNPKLLNVVKRNSLEKRDMLSGDLEAFAFINAEWQKIQESAHSKVALIFEIAELANQRKLLTHVSNQKAHFEGWFNAVRQDHPIAFWVGLIGLISSVVTISGGLVWLLQTVGAARP